MILVEIDIVKEKQAEWNYIQKNKNEKQPFRILL